MQVITGGARTFTALAFQNQHPDNQGYFAQKVADLTNTFGDTLSDIGNGFMSGAAALYDSFYGSDAMRAARAAVRKVKSLWDRDDIRALCGIGEQQDAKPVMQRWLMAEPTYRELYHQQRVDGYSDEYVDMEPGAVGNDHYDYRRVTDGLLVTVEDPDSDHDWEMVHHIEDLREGDVDLEIDQVSDILESWRHRAMHVVAGGKDPGSKYNDNM